MPPPAGGQSVAGSTTQHGAHAAHGEQGGSPGAPHHPAMFCRRKHSAPSLCLRPVAPLASGAAAAASSSSIRRQRAVAAEAVLTLRKAPLKLHRRAAHLMLAAASNVRPQHPAADTSAGADRPAVATAAEQAAGDSEQAPDGQARLLSISSSNSTAGLVAALGAMLSPRPPAGQQAAEHSFTATTSGRRLPGLILPVADGTGVHKLLQVPHTPSHSTPSHSSQTQATGSQGVLAREQSIRSAPPADALPAPAAPAARAASPPRLDAVMSAVELLLRLAATKVSATMAQSLAEDVAAAIAAASAEALACGRDFDLATELLGVVPVLQQVVVQAWCKAQASDAAAATAVVAALLQQPAPSPDQAARPAPGTSRDGAAC